MELYKIQKNDKRLLFNIAIPVMLESIINALFSIMDTAMLGHSPNSNQAISSVGVTGAVTNLFIFVIMNLCVGATVVISQSLGAGNKDKCRKTAMQCFPFIIIIGLLSTVVLSGFAPQIITLLGANDEIKEDAIAYLRIIGYGIFFQTISLYITAAFRGIGQTKIPMFYNMGAGVVNVIGNYCLINGHFGFPALRVVGAAWATTFSKIVMCIVALILFFRLNTEIKPNLKDIYEKGCANVIESFKVGFFIALEMLLMQLGAVITTAIITDIETTPYAASQVTTSAQTMIWAVLNSFHTAATSMVGMAWGEKNIPKVKATIKYIWKVGFIFATFLVIAYVFGGSYIASFYTKDAVVYTLAGKLMRISAVMIYAGCTYLPMAGGMRGMSHPIYPLIADIISIWIFKVLATFICVKLLGLGIEWVIACSTADQVSRALLCYVFLKLFYKKEKL